jgi:hypothetical protein
MIDNNKDQDEWTNSLTLGSKLFRIRIRIRITEPELSLDNRTQNSGPEPKGVSINWSNWESRSWTQGVSIKSSRKRLRTKILSQFQITYWRRISSWTISSIFIIIYRINQGSGSVDRWDGSIFFQPIFSSLISGNEVSLTLLSTMGHWKLG